MRTLIPFLIGIYIMKKYDTGIVETTMIMIGSYVFLGIIGMI
ncbi:MAG: hypothetical protein OSJ72_17415 [Lachnospiraceae bacterium]|nr:hypothetical protein [Lachnospiraceae bacterium]